MFHDTHKEVVVVGGGPVGLTLALYLAREGVKVTVLERDQTISTEPRAMVYLRSLLPDLDELGMLEEMRERAWIDREGFNLHLPDFDEVISIPMDVLGDEPYSYNVHLGQGEYCDIAFRKLAGYPNAEVVLGAEVVGVTDSDSGAEVHLADGSTLAAKWVVGADGGRSMVRAAMGARLEGTTWPERFVATNVRFDFRAHGFKGSNMFVHDEIGCVVAQITPDGIWRCTYQESDLLPEETVADRIPQHFARLLGEDAKVDVVSFRPYRMHQRLATTLHKGHVVLAGDAAHLTNPTGGLGLTTGLYDVFLLQEVLINILRHGADEALLDHYAEERSRVFREVSSPNATNFKRLVYDSHDRSVLTQAVQPLRAAAATEESRRAFLNNADAVRSPSLAAAP